MQLQVHRAQPTGLHAGAPRSTVKVEAAIFDLVAPELAETEGLLVQSLSSMVPAVAEIGRYLVGAGGKRLRPLVTALGARAAGHWGPIARLMCVGELVHLGSLLHDDVVDDGQERRGRPAAQRVYGNPAVILTGDFCVARGLSIAAEEAGLLAATELARTVAAMSEGEVAQLLNIGNLGIGVDAYYDVIDKKSASLIAWCASSGAWARGDADAAAALGQFGREVGSAFQIADDVLDFVGEERLTGKARGQDLAQRKPTLPLILAMDRSKELRERITQAAPDPAEIPALLELVERTGAPADALAIARERVARGLAALEVLAPSPALDALRLLGHHLVERTR